MSEVKETYYRQKIPLLIADLKTAVENNRKVITQDIGDDLGEDKYLNVLKSRRMAAEDIIYFLKEIDRLEAEMNGVEVKEEDSKSDSEKPTVHPSKRHARN